MGVSDNPKKSSVKKIQNGIEVTLGNPNITKYDVMKEIAKNYSIYGATVWLNTPLPLHDHKTPAELMKEGQMELVASIAAQEKKAEKEK